MLDVGKNHTLRDSDLTCVAGGRGLRFPAPVFSPCVSGRQWFELHLQPDWKAMTPPSRADSMIRPLALLLGNRDPRLPFRRHKAPSSHRKLVTAPEAHYHRNATHVGQHD